MYLILALALVLRVFWISDYPTGFTPDEASFGYDAYSILKTGKDQWGRFLPLYLESFGDFKSPLYSYLTIPSVYLFGLNVFSTRLPNALLGSASIYITYLLVLELLKDKKILFKNTGALISSFLLAVSPWHVMLSRGAFEANLTTLFMPLGILLFIKGIRKNAFLPISLLFFGLNMFTYHSAKLVTPFVVCFLICIFWKELKKVDIKYLIYSGVILFITIFLTLYSLNQGTARRAYDLSISKGALEAQADERLKVIEKGVNPVVARIFHNKYLVIASRFTATYKQFFSVKFLFKDGAGEATYGMIPGIGVLYWFEAPLILMFLFSLFKSNWRKAGFITLFWIVISPIPASLATGVGYAANRTAVMMPAVQIASGLGLMFLLNQVINKSSVKFSSVFTVVILAVGIFSLGSFLKTYIIFYPQHYSKSMLYGNVDAGYWLANYSESFSQIIISTSLSEPHIYVAFANIWNPKEYQNETLKWNIYKEKGLTFLDQLPEYSLANYLFKKIEPEDLLKNRNTLLVGRPDEFPQGIKILKTFYYANGTPSILVVKPFGDLYAKKAI